MRCKYCQGKLQNKNATKCSDHTMKCQARINAGVEYNAIPNSYHRASPGPSNASLIKLNSDELMSASRSLLTNDMNGIEFGPSTSHGNNRSKVVSPTEAKKRKLQEVLNELFDDTLISSRKKPVHMLSDEEFRREERELRLKEQRLNVKHLQLKNQLLERLLPLSERASEAVERYLALTENAVAHQEHNEDVPEASVFEDEQQVSIVYANPNDDPSGPQA